MSKPGNKLKSIQKKSRRTVTNTSRHDKKVLAQKEVKKSKTHRKSNHRHCLHDCWENCHDTSHNDNMCGCEYTRHNNRIYELPGPYPWMPNPYFAPCEMPYVTPFAPCYTDMIPCVSIPPIPMLFGNCRLPINYYL